MGAVLSSFFQSGSALLSTSNHRNVSETTKKNIRIVFDALRANPRVTVQRLDGLLSVIPKHENILHVHNEEGYNLLQKAVGINNVEIVRWCLTRNVDINRGACSLPLHIACLKGYYECMEVLLKHGARVDVEARMCWPGPHNQNCEQRGKYSNPYVAAGDRSSDKLQNAIFYAIDGDQVQILEHLTQSGDEHWLPWQQKRPLLHVACDRGAWECVKYLCSTRPFEINQLYDDYYPIHHAALHHLKFLNLLIQCGAITTSLTYAQQMTVLHVVFLIAKKNAEDTLETIRVLLQHGLKDHINKADILGNTPLHSLIVRCALEVRRYGYYQDSPPWSKWDMLHILRYLLQNGAANSINQPGNSALACVLRQVKDWDIRYDLLEMLLNHGGDPNLVGRDGSVPLMVCLVPLINKDPLDHFTHSMKVFYLNCVRLLCKHRANPNCLSRSNLTPLHVLMFSARENIALSRDEEKAGAFSFIQQLLVILLQHGLDPNVRLEQRTQHVLLSLMEIVQNARTASDIDHVYELTKTLLQYGANPNINISDTEPMICHSQSSVFLKKSSNHVLYHYVQHLTKNEKLLSDPEQRFRNLLNLYYYSMNHLELHQCLRIFDHTSLVCMNKNLFSALKELCARPRSLKQICRVVIYNSVGRRPAKYLNKLSLPVPLKDYILNFEP